MSEDLGITVSKEEDIGEWYRQVILKSELADYTEVSGCIVYRPRAYGIWENVKGEVDKRFKDIGIENSYFPMFIPEKLLEKEAEHFEGFTPEVAWVTHTGSSELDERLAVRPTSEAIMYDSFNKWIRSWRDLPLRLNQWNNVVRWEFKHATPFLRSREFLWNEGHNAYRDEETAMEDRDKVLGAYQEVLENYLALPGIPGKKSEMEKFDGAVSTYSIEHMLPDGKAIQGPDYHYDGTNFAEAFDITYEDEDGEEKYVHQTTYAITTRELGAMVMAHSDDKGLVMPPHVAPTKSVIIPIPGDDKEKVIDYVEEIGEDLEDCEIDDRDGYTPGWKFNEWEVKGIPVRIEIGPNEVEDGEATLVRRDTGEKVVVEKENIEEKVDKLLNGIHENLLKKAKKVQEDSIREASDVDSMVEIIEEYGGFVKAPFCNTVRCEEELKDETTIKTTNMPFRYDEPEGKECVNCGKGAEAWAHFAKSY